MKRQIQPVKSHPRKPAGTAYSNQGLRLASRNRRRRYDGTIFEAILALVLLTMFVLGILVGGGAVAFGTLVELTTPANIVTSLIVVNFLVFAALGIDKARAETGAWRVRESTLLSFALLGGTPAAYAARALFRHKTRKQPFSSQLFTIAVLQMLGLGGWIGWNWM